MKKTATLAAFAAALLCVSSSKSNAAPPAAPAGMQWERVEALSDEFNGTTIDSNKWFDTHPFWEGRLPSKFKQGNAFVANGNLNLRNTSRIDNISQVARPFDDHWIDAAAIVSKQKIAEPGWYYECSMRASDCAMSSAFWFRVGAFSEIDVVEHIGHATKSPEIEARTSREYGCNTHVYGTMSAPSIGKVWNMPVKGRDTYVTYGFLWQDANTLIFYFNDIEVMRVKPAVPFTENLRMIFDTEALSSTFVGLPTIESLKDNNRNTTYVNWVRSYKLATPPAATGLPKVGQRIALKGSNGLYVSSENGLATMTCNRSSIGAWELFTVADAGTGRIALLGSNGQYVSSENGSSPMNCNRNALKAWETFTTNSVNGNVITLRGNNNRFVTVTNAATPLTCNSTSSAAPQQFTWELR